MKRAIYLLMRSAGQKEYVITILKHYFLNKPIEEYLSLLNEGKITEIDFNLFTQEEKLSLWLDNIVPKDLDFIEEDF